MKKHLYLLLFVVVALMSACNTTEQIRLTTMRPAEIEYHRTRPHLAVVNNSRVPDATALSRYTDENGAQYKLSFVTDSMPHFMATSLATQLYDTHFFEQVDLLLPDSTHVTGVAGVDSMLVAEWKRNYPDDVHLVINDISPCVIMRTDAMGGYFATELMAVTTVQMQCVIPRRPLFEVIVSDTLVWYGYGDTPAQTQAALPLIDEVLQEAMHQLSARIVERCAPYERVVDRYLFSTGHVAMKDACKYWQNDMREEASYVWEYVLAEGKDNGRRARAAANLALYNELQDDYEKALEYAREAQRLFIAANDVAEAEYVMLYCKDLEKRIEERDRLNHQLD